MANLGTYQASEETLGDYSPIPPGKYVAVITESDLIDNKSGTGSYIKFKFEIMDGEYKGRLVWNNMTYTHQNSTAQQIGRKELNTLMKACGLNEIQDTQQLHGIAHAIEVKIKQDEGYEPSNEIKNYFALGGEAQPVQNAPTKSEPQSQAPAESGKVTPSWSR